MPIWQGEEVSGKRDAPPTNRAARAIGGGLTPLRVHPMPVPIDLTEKLLRLGAAVLVGSIVGLNRDLHGKPAGLRTHALVAVGAALITLASAELMQPGDGSIARTFQGIITGVGFLGAGVILHPSARTSQIHGLTTAASIWVVACIGAGCGAGTWATALLGAAITLVILTLGGWLERGAEELFRRKGKRPDERDDDAPKTGGG
jgi:putative Mg2+ transporter-C (MgtC) family protein